ncbi:MAG TPA: CoA-binding protein [Candidatus Nanopelagicaceae bacterium]|nr:CoA-binding protein [Candidatus Nanopelagicaceae bacterium]
MSRDHFVHGFLNPKSVAFFGANNKGGSLAAIQIMNLIKSEYSGNVYPIHPKLETVMGFKTYKTISDVPEIPDLVVIVLTAKIVPHVFKECGEKGVNKIVLISGGFRELSGDRKNTLTEEINEIAKKYGIRFIGPNCLGVFNNWFEKSNSNSAFNIAIWEHLKKGNFSIASQSGTLSSHIWFDPEHLDLGLSKSLSVGNEANIDIVDCLEYYKDDEETEVIGLYIEELKRGKRFLELAREITPKKPIIAIYVGGSQGGNRALQSHTGSLAGDSKIYNAIFKETGVIKTDYVQEFLDIALILSNKILPKGNRIGIITNSGGPGAMIANNAEKHGLVVPEFSESLQKELKAILPTTAGFNNPVDCTFDMNLSYFYINLPEILMKSGEVDAIFQYGVVGFQDVMNDYLQNEKIAKWAEFENPSEEQMDKLAEKLLKPTMKNSREYSVPIFYINPMSFTSPWSKRLRRNGAMLFKLWDRPVNALAKVCEYIEYKQKQE